MRHHTTAADADSTLPDWIHFVHRQIETLRYGVVQIIVHDGKIVQIERTEKTRLNHLRSELGGSAPADPAVASSDREPILAHRTNWRRSTIQATEPS